MEHKLLTAILYIKDGEAVTGLQDKKRYGDIFELAALYNDCGIDRLIALDLSKEDIEHEKNLGVIKELVRVMEIPVCGGGNINRLEDIKKFLYAGCSKVILNSNKSTVMQLAEEGAERFGKEKIMLSLDNIDILFKKKEIVDYVGEFLVLNEASSLSFENMSDLLYTAFVEDFAFDKCVEILKKDKVAGIAGSFLNDVNTDVMELKARFADAGVSINRLEAAFEWEEFKLNEEGLIPVIVQDYKTQEVLMLAYMNEEAFRTTLLLGKMTYYSRSRKELWIKGMTSGHIQYVKSLTLDCDYDTILAKVSQVGGIACHTGAPSCFFNELTSKEYIEKNPLKVFENVYNVIMDRKNNPKTGSYTNYLFDKGIDKILKKVGEEATEIVIAAKNPDPEEIKYEISDFLYHIMVLMAVKGITWEDIMQELVRR